jgi:hypothetical protein
MRTFAKNFASFFIRRHPIAPLSGHAVNRRVVSYREEPPAFHWWNPIEDRRASYTADFAVRYQTGETLCCEVRPKKLLGILNNPAVLLEREVAAERAGYSGYRVYTEHDICRVRLANAKLLFQTRRFHSGGQAHLDVMRRTVAWLGGRDTIRNLRIYSNLGPRSWPAVIALVARDELRPISDSRPLDNRMVVFDPTRFPDQETAP